MPLPKKEIDDQNTLSIENDQDSEFEKLLKTQDENTDVENSKENNNDLEKKIIDKIK